MRYPAAEKLEIIRLVEQSRLPVRRTLDKLGVLPARFYRWDDRYQSGGYEALKDRPPSSLWLKGRKGSRVLHSRMAMSRRKDRARTPGLWIATNALPVTGASVLSAAKSGPGHARVRRVRRGARPVLRRDGRPSQSAAGDLFPAALDRVLRGHRSVGSPGGLPTRWRCAAFSGWASMRRHPSHYLPDAAADRPRDAPGGLHVDPAGAGDGRSLKGKTIGIDATTLEANAAASCAATPAVSGVLDAARGLGHDFLSASARRRAAIPTGGIHTLRGSRK